MRTKKQRGKGKRSTKLCCERLCFRATVLQNGS
uniref:Uncharacterized protein n=1 Tax=Anguilla anguilla TaxID=7936 RepID=A0A0E9SZW5_ANGAN